MNDTVPCGLCINGREVVWAWRSGGYEVPVLTGKICERCKGEGLVPNPWLYERLDGKDLHGLRKEQDDAKKGSSVQNVFDIT